MGAAKAALTSNFRGQPYKGPDKGGALARLKALYKQQGMKWEEADVIAEIGRRLNKKQLDQLRAAQETIRTILSWADYEDVEEQDPPSECECPECGHTQEKERGTPCRSLKCPECGATMQGALSEFVEDSSGHAVRLVEAAPPGAIVPLTLDAVLIEPGFGNKRDGHYYPKEVLKRDANVFAGIKMYETDHVQKDKSTRTWVSTVKEIVGFTSTGAPIGKVVVHVPSFAERVLALDEAELLDKMECSILATGMAKKGKVEGRKARIVESITEADSVDWVTRAGAGGRALSLSENEGGSMDPKEKEQEEQELEEVQISEDSDEDAPDPEPLSEEAVAERLGETNLPQASRDRLSEAEYADEDELEEAVQAEVDYVKAITGSGKPFGIKGRASPRQARTEEQCREDFDRILEEAGGRRVYG
jgi:hypothetical protein